jgi:hypothetical protein
MVTVILAFFNLRIFFDLYDIILQYVLLWHDKVREAPTHDRSVHENQMEYIGLSETSNLIRG